MEQKLEVLQTANEYMVNLINGLNTCVEYCRIGNVGEANQYIGLIVDGLEWVINVIALTQDIREVPIEVMGIKEILNELVEAMENNDTTLVADLLEYEILEQVILWQEIVANEVAV